MDGRKPRFIAIQKNPLELNRAMMGKDALRKEQP
jgi:hypothetical protein